MPERAEQVRVMLNETRSGSIVQRRGEREGSQSIYFLNRVCVFFLPQRRTEVQPTVHFLTLRSFVYSATLR